MTPASGRSPVFSRWLKAALWIFAFGFAGSAVEAAKPVWRIGADVFATPSLVAAHGGLEAFRAKVQQQFDIANAAFNNSGAFHGEFRFEINTLSEYSGSVWEPILQPLRDAHFKLVYDENEASPWWYWGPRSILFGWKLIDGAGPFGPRSTAALIHEFGHTRGAIDLYAIEVNSHNNPINRTGYDGPSSWMDSPYGVTVWDEHSVNLINAAESDVQTQLVERAFPDRFVVRAVDRAGVPIPGAVVRLFPVEWTSMAVSATARFSGVTDAAGQFTLPTNPFEPSSSGIFYMRTPNFLVQVESTGRFGYAWLPVTSVQNAWFANTNAPYVLDVQTPAETFYEWAARVIPGTNAPRGFADDADRDGIPNGLEYAFGADPNKASRLLRSEVREGRPVVSVPAPRAYLPDAMLWYESAPALTGPWTIVRTATMRDAAGEDRVELIPANAQAPGARFFRVRVWEVF